MSKVFTVNIVCRSCDGTGLYAGMAERDECAVVCCTCDGTGCEKLSIEYTPFTERKRRDGIKRVFLHSSMYIHSAHDITTVDGKLIEFSKGGCTYEQWLNGEKPKPVKELYCPYMWTRQGMQSSSHEGHRFYKNHCLLSQKFIAGYISQCQEKHRDKAKCWELYEKELARHEEQK